MWYRLFKIKCHFSLAVRWNTYVFNTRTSFHFIRFLHVLTYICAWMRCDMTYHKISILWKSVFVNYYYYYYYIRIVSPPICICVWSHFKSWKTFVSRSTHMIRYVWINKWSYMYMLMLGCWLPACRIRPGKHDCADVLYVVATNQCYYVTRIMIYGKIWTFVNWFCFNILYMWIGIPKTIGHLENVSLFVFDFDQPTFGCCCLFGIFFYSFLFIYLFFNFAFLKLVWYLCAAAKIFIGEHVELYICISIRRMVALWSMVDNLYIYVSFHIIYCYPQ